MNASLGALATVLPSVKPWAERAKSVLPLAGGYQCYLDTLAWILQQCSDDQMDEAALSERYAARFRLTSKVAKQQVWSLRRCGLLFRSNGGLIPSATSISWLANKRPGLVIGTMHANARLIAELVELVQEPRTDQSLLQAATNRYDLVSWKTPAQINYRLGWLRSAGFVDKLPDKLFQATEAGLAFLECVDLQLPIADSSTDEPRQLTSDDEPSTPAPGPPRPPKLDTAPPSASLPSLVTADEIAQRLASLSRDGARHKEFETAVRDAFRFLGLEAKQLSGAGQTDVLVEGACITGASGHTDSASRSFAAVVEVKAVGNGRLTSNQVDLMTIKKHRGQHGADYALIVGPGPAGQLLDYARDESIGVLDSARLAELVRAQDEMPLAAREFQRLFADAAGGPAGGEVDLRPLAEARKQHRRLRDLLCGVFRAVSEIDDSNAGTAIPPVVQFALTGQGLSASIAEVESALQLLATPWFDACDLLDEGSHRYVPTITPHQIAQRLRWLADAFDEIDGATATSSESG